MSAVSITLGERILALLGVPIPPSPLSAPAVREADELHPDLILFDVGLPSLNGIEVARRVRQFSPESKILFVSQETSVDVVQEALGLGALGYVAKRQAGIELLPAVNQVCQGRRFVSSAVGGFVFCEC
jgi:DNA-binding NarL/FixJ family response regulator